LTTTARTHGHPALLICFLTFVIHLIGTLAYSVRIAGVRTRRIAVSFAPFSILVLVARTSNSFLGPFLANASNRTWPGRSRPTCWRTCRA
jgi:hypothetical protein